MRIALIVMLAAGTAAAQDEEGFISLFNGKDLTGWKVSENPDSVRVEDGAIVTNGKRAHCFYVGDVKNHDFKNFEFKAEVLCKANSNAGIYFHTAFQEKGWPSKGFEAQVCSAGYKDPKKTGSLYGIKNVDTPPVADNEWFKYHIIVKGKSVTIRINDKTITEWTQPDDYAAKGFKGRILDRGTFALQAHDPGSTVLFRKLRVKPLDD